MFDLSRITLAYCTPPFGVRSSARGLGCSNHHQRLLALFFLVAMCSSPALQLAKPAHEWRSGNDLNKLYDSATPNPTGSLSGPWFDMPEIVNITGIKGKNTHLVCRIKNLGNQTVSWIRHTDTHLLTTGLYTYTPERRFSAIHRSSSEDWVLEIRDVQVDDQGVYECQVSTTPIRSQLMTLHVAEPVITMQGGGELHIKFGSRINISCEISNFPKPINYIVWYKDDQPLMESDRIVISLAKSKSHQEHEARTKTKLIPTEFQSLNFSPPLEPSSSSYPDPGTSTAAASTTDISLKASATTTTVSGRIRRRRRRRRRRENHRHQAHPGGITSSLLVKRARSSDTGNYKCASEAGESKPTSIHVITGETRAGLQVNGGSPIFQGTPLRLETMVVAIWILFGTH